MTSCYKCGSKKELIGAGVRGNKGQAICSKCYVMWWEEENGELK